MIYLLVLVPLVLADKQCLLSRDTGEFCDQPAGQRFFFDLRTKKCQPFYYKGCGGNANRFDSSDICTKTCSDTKGSASTAIHALCKSGAYSAGATSLSEPLPCSECPKGYVCEDDMCCPTKEYLCNLQYDAGKFGDQGSHRPRYFYSKSFNNCMLFTYYGRDGNANNFETYNECKAMCMS